MREQILALINNQKVTKSKRAILKKGQYIKTGLKQEIYNGLPINLVIIEVMWFLVLRV